MVSHFRLSIFISLVVILDSSICLSLFNFLKDRRLSIHYYLLPVIYYRRILLNHYLPKGCYLISLERVSSIIILSRGRSNTFTTIITCIHILMKDLLFHFRLYLLRHLSMNQNLSALLHFGNIDFNSINNSASSSTTPHSYVHVCGCDLNPTNTSSISLPTGIDSLLLVPGDTLSLHSFDSLPTDVILPQLIGEDFPLLLFFQEEEATLILQS